MVHGVRPSGATRSTLATMRWKVIGGVGVLGIVAAFSACDDPEPGLTSAISSSSSATGSAASGWSTSSGGPCGQHGCDADEYCGYAPGNECGYGTQGCYPLPTCDPATPACGCDVYDYPNACDAQVHGGGVLVEAKCATLFEQPPGTFKCAYDAAQIPKFCKLGEEYCHIEPQEGPYKLQCKTLPAACPAEPTDCNCLMDPCTVGGTCTADPTTHAITTICPP